MQHTTYNNIKKTLKAIANTENQGGKSDKPATRQMINDYVDSFLKGELSAKWVGEKRAALYEKWLSSYACTLHPKD